MKQLFFILFVSCALLNSACKKIEPTPVLGKVIDGKTKNGVAGAKVTVDGKDVYVTNANGDFTASKDLGKYIVDSINFNIDAKGYELLKYHSIVGNSQKETFVITLTPRELLKYSTKNLIIDADQAYSTLRIDNNGLTKVTCNLSATKNWINYGSATIQVSPDAPAFLPINVDSTGMNPCGESGFLWIDWGNHRDTIRISKVMPDKIRPTVIFPLVASARINAVVILDGTASYDKPCLSKELEYIWKIDGLAISYSSFINHTFYNTGSHTVSLTVDDGQTLPTTLSKTIQITP
jgi:hypothetical protein